MTNILKGKRSSGKLKTMGDHNEFLNRITKSLYYSKLPITDRLSLPVTEFAAELFSEVKSGCSLERLDVEEASRISRNACVSPCSFVLALLYLERLKDCNPEYLYKVAPSELFLVSLMVASKFLNDDGEDDEVFNTEWAKSGKLTVAHMNRLEKEFLIAINWSIYVCNKDFWNRFHELEKDIAYKEAKKRDWFSYSELNCLMDIERLKDVIQMLINISSICLATYTAGVFVLLSSAIIASHIPGTSLAPKQSNQLFNINHTQVESDFTNETSHLGTTEYLNVDNCLKCHIIDDGTCDVSKTSIEIPFVDFNWWLSSAITWLSNDSQSNESPHYGIETDELRNSGAFITNSHSLLNKRSEWEDLIIEINWKETLDKNSNYEKNNWRYYADYVTKISMGHRH
ncbi:hypothetical protein PV327_010230 [Microctonus hyperodae]|uniref:Protein CNPPD1 n=1 Tax=Microctonus hyperodae TaxID=165561 RepID=A0AA39FRT2_MICHY|nr:hypothetical protein PV327_010230 [Microctonus hyperodae]